MKVDQLIAALRQAEVSITQCRNAFIQQCDYNPETGESYETPRYEACAVGAAIAIALFDGDLARARIHYERARIHYDVTNHYWDQYFLQAFADPDDEQQTAHLMLRMEAWNDDYRWTFAEIAEEIPRFLARTPEEEA
jgi:hypothetical protein